MCIDLYLDSQVAPALQLDVNHETHQKLFRSATKISLGTHQPTDTAIFDDTRAQLFKELLPYWAGFKFACSVNPADGSITFPLTKQERMLRERLEEFMQMRKPSASDFKLPSLVGTANQLRRANTPGGGGGGSDRTAAPQKTSLNIVFSIASGIRYKDDRESNIAKQAAANGSTRPPTVLMSHLRSNSTSDRRNSNAVNVK